MDNERQEDNELDPNLESDDSNVKNIKLALKHLHESAINTATTATTTTTTTNNNNNTHDIINNNLNKLLLENKTFNTENSMLINKINQHRKNKEQILKQLNISQAYDTEYAHLNFIDLCNELFAALKESRNKDIDKIAIKKILAQLTLLQRMINDPVFLQTLNTQIEENISNLQNI
ncbi:uncharacterized protein SCDLUD_000363 [Saccharomycodes ludwigii]|uniref:uncharacterized protein n=1 Tax=Saccharomycodes ludwigii TaxID=36035 RepID=UPI001E88D366|nr:hypothetical protein SCDLUD_000363 [Saccharomycodes ludwigii]KAH3902774.1 hypothetical protein SCDLUD_000363 [Saccharomycodes ludwigii]